MRLHWMSASFRRVGDSLRGAGGNAFCCGLLGGLYLLDWTHQFAANFGTSLVVAIAATLALAMGCELGLRRPRRSSAASNPAKRFAAAQFALAVHTVAFPLWTFAARGLAGAFTVEMMAVPLVGLIFYWCVACALLTAPTALLVRTPHDLGSLLTARGTVTASTLLACYSLIGASCGLCLGVFVIAPYFGSHVAGLLAAACGVAAVAVVWRRRDLPVATADGLAADLQPQIAHASSRLGIRLQSIVSCALLGAGMALASRATRQLMPASAFLLYAEWAAVLLVCALSAGFVERKGRTAPVRNPARLAAWCCLLCATWGAICLLTFHQVIEYSLAVTSSISNITLLMLVRTATAAAFSLPFAAALGTISAVASPSSLAISPGRRPHRAWGAPWLILAFAGGTVITRLALAGGMRTSDLFAGVSLLLVVPAISWWWTAAAFPRKWVARGFAAAGIIVACSAPLFREHYNPVRAARILFSTNVFGAYRGGVERDYLPVLDAGRNVAVRESDHGTLTLWKHNGSQYHIRENGIPKGILSANPGISPQYSPEILPAALALTLHESPRHVLILGMGSSCSLSTTLAFPIETVTCFEGDAALIEVFENEVWPSASVNPRKDDRVKIVSIDPALAMPCRDARYDVVLSNCDALALAQAEPGYTSQFYTAAARRIGGNGIFAQRFSLVDLGAKPFATLVRTMQSVFVEVDAVEIGPAEFVFFATNSPQGVVRDDTLRRLQADQMRRVLSQIGWDWTVPLNIAAFSHAELEKLAAGAPVNNASNGQFAFTIPQEVMRWGMKAQELYTALAPHASRLFAWENIPDDDPDVLRRLADVTARHNLSAKYTDQPWAYRKEIRGSLEDNPRSLVQQVKHQVLDRSLHPDDRRRMDYLTALGNAARQARPSVSDIDAVVEFEAPYDPLVSHYLHYEVASLYARVPGSDHSAELGHSLYAINYSDASDRSVRDVVAAIELLAAHPEACPDPSERYDHLNSLTQVLKARWEARGTVEPTASRIVLIDTEKSISALETSFDTLRALCAEAEVPHDECDARCAYLEKSIVRPLRTYRSKLLPHHLSEERKNRTATKESAESPKSLPAEFRLPGVE